ncbi:DUF2938 family protein [Kluyvera intermedia]|jgi:uncharacterized membrane protein YagU involved in acid resistance|uniref:DUF2938 family protein n=1 Tax=Kluyvera intermedia TaxID=61648 RepID=A0ABX6DR46_KLUIN|nr:DUF2938 family protein [Kluyvera intermedia]QGH31287.1 DUF2938 family protein [Kluyvera intermedia]QGH40269.1 DUF2938 family protein [Kluyvera intermedia]
MIFNVFLLMVGSGVVATAVGDLVSRCVFGKSHWDLVGRWIAGIPRGKWINADITHTPSLSYEAALGWGFHYLTGIIYGVMYIGLCLFSGTEPNLISAITFGIMTVLAPFFILMPGMGIGVLARNSPTPLKKCLSALFAHVVFGAGLWIGAQCIRISMSS